MFIHYSFNEWLFNNAKICICFWIYSKMNFQILESFPLPSSHHIIWLKKCNMKIMVHEFGWKCICFEKLSMYLTLLDFVIPLSWYFGSDSPLRWCKFQFHTCTFSHSFQIMKSLLTFTVFFYKWSSSLSEAEMIFFLW